MPVQRPETLLAVGIMIGVLAASGLTRLGKTDAASAISCTVPEAKDLKRKHGPPELGDNENEPD